MQKRLIFAFVFVLLLVILIIPKAEAQVCGDTITTDVTLTGDLLNCPGNGLTIGANGITLDCDGHTISASGIGFGIDLPNRQNVVVKNCIVQGFTNGFFLSGSSNNILTDNTANNNERGFDLSSSSNNNILTNNVAENNGNGFILTSSSNNDNTLTNNTIINNNIGVRLFSSNNLIYNNFFNNTINAQDNSNNFWNITKTPSTNIIGGDSLGGNFWHDYLGVDNNGDGLGDTLLPYNSNGNILNGGDFLPLVLSCGSTIIQDTTLTSDLVCSGNGLTIGANDITLDCQGHTISGNGGFVGILAQNRQNIMIKNCIVQNFEFGFILSSSSNNILTNNIAQNNNVGFLLTSSSNNTLTDNTIISNNLGMSLSISNTNLIYNNFFNNTLKNAEDNGNNFWNITQTPGTNIINGSSLGGNFWSDYTGTDNDGDGLGDTLLPYTSNGNIANGGDFLPLVPGLPGISCGDTIIQDTTLTSDLVCSGNGLTIGANDITLDCRGHTISGNGGFDGIFAQSRQNITIKNCIVQNFAHGIRFVSTTQSQLINNTANNNGFGFILSLSSNNILTSNTADNNNFFGFDLVVSNSNTFTNNRANNNDFYGFTLSFSNSNTFTNNRANNNDFYGFFLALSSNNNILTSNTVKNNSVRGINIINSNDNLIYNNFFNNTLNAQDNGNNFWNITQTSGTNIIDGPFLGGNFWHDYTGVDNDVDGIGDTLLPYNSSGNIANGGDFLPLVFPVCVQPPSNMISWWPGDGNANDIQDGNNGTLLNGVTFAAGKVDQAFSFDGVDDFLRVTDANNLDFGLNDSLTMDAWIKTGSSSTQRIIGKQTVAGQNGIYLLRLFPAGTLQFFLRDTNGVVTSVTSTALINDSLFHHVAGVRDIATDTIRIYIDGVQVGSTTDLTTGSFVTNIDLLIGAYSSTPGSNNFDGLIDEVELFNRALSASEIQTIFNAGSAGKCKITTFDFNVTVSPQNKTVRPGANAIFMVDVILLSGISQNVNLTVTVVNASNAIEPSITSSIFPSTVLPTSIATLFLGTNSSTPNGNYKAIVTGTSGTIQKTANVTLIVSGPPLNNNPIAFSDFTVKLVTGTPGANETKVPSTGSFIIVLVNGSGFSVIDNDATDGVAIIQLINGNYKFYGRLTGGNPAANMILLSPFISGFVSPQNITLPKTGPPTTVDITSLNPFLLRIPAPASIVDSANVNKPWVSLFYPSPGLPYNLTNNNAQETQLIFISQ